MIIELSYFGISVIITCVAFLYVFAYLYGRQKNQENCEHNWLHYRECLRCKIKEKEVRADEEV